MEEARNDTAVVFIERSIYEHLSDIQSSIRVSKGHFNKFGGYYYRSCEDIMEAAKPLLKEKGLVLALEDEVVNIGDRYYVKATATIYLGVNNMTGNDRLSVSAYAREEEAKKGMDGAQITGSASSYARKYALSGLFAIDDSKDPDTNESSGSDTQTVLPQPTDKQVLLIKTLFSKLGVEKEVRDQYLLKVTSIHKADDLIKQLQDKISLNDLKTNAKGDE